MRHLAALLVASVALIAAATPVDPFWGQKTSTWMTEWQAAWVWTP